MTYNLAASLMRTKHLDRFLRKQKDRPAWRTMSVLKTEVDRLIDSDLDKAARLTVRIEELAALMGDGAAEAFASASRARVLDHKGRPAEANPFYEAAIAGMRASGLGREAAVVQKQQLHALICMGRYADALRAGRGARRVLEKADPLELALLEINIGNIYYRLDKYRAALNHYEAAQVRIAKLRPRTPGTRKLAAFGRALIDFGRSNVLLETDRPDEAMALLRKAADGFQRNGHELQAEHARSHLAYLQFMRGNYNAALTTYYELRDRLIALGSADPVAWCNQDIAEVLLALNAFEAAAESATSAAAQFSDLQMPYESAQAKLLRGLAHMGLGKSDDGDLAEAREVFAKTGNATLTAVADCCLAELALRGGQPGEASRRAAISARIFKKQGLRTKFAYARLLQARAAHELGDSRNAKRKARQALATVANVFAPHIAYQCHHLLGLIERDGGRLAKARACFRLAVAAVEQMRGGITSDEFKTRFLRDKIRVYEDAVAACLDAGDDSLVEEAFRLVEASKSRALADLLARYVRGVESAGSKGGKATAKSGSRKRFLDLIEELNWSSAQADVEDERGDRRALALADRHRDRICRYERQVAQAFGRLEAEDANFAQIQRMEPAGVGDLRDALEPGETAIEYFITGDRVSAFVVSKQSVRVARDIASKAAVEALLAGLHFQVEKFRHSAAHLQQHSDQLKLGIDEHLNGFYEAIFEPLELMIADTNLVIIPHGLLHYVPFHALWDGRNYLVDLFEISYAPSAAVLRLCRARSKLGHPHSDERSPQIARRREGRQAAAMVKQADARLEASLNAGSPLGNGHRKRGRLVAMGVIDGDTPHIGDEIRALGLTFPDAIQLTQEDATRKNLFRFGPRARYLHIASHGLFRADNPMFSFLKLTDAHLNFYSLLDLKLSAEMVTLSACQTGVNAIFPGDELHGLMRGFLYAGAPSLVVSLWMVNDRSTTELMSAMYGLIKEGAAKRAALRQAQLKVREKYSHPYYWAPFILMGDPI